MLLACQAFQQPWGILQPMIRDWFVALPVDDISNEVLCMIVISEVSTMAGGGAAPVSGWCVVLVVEWNSINSRNVDAEQWISIIIAITILVGKGGKSTSTCTLTFHNFNRHWEGMSTSFMLSIRVHLQVVTQFDYSSKNEYTHVRRKHRHALE